MTSTSTTPGEDTFSVSLSFQGKTVSLDTITTHTTTHELHQWTLEALGLSERTSLKLLYKGRQLYHHHHHHSSTAAAAAVTDTPTPTPTPTIAFLQRPTKPPKIMVLATSPVVLEELATKRSDPTLRGFDQEERAKQQMHQTLHWGNRELSQQDQNYKFCRFDACTWQSFGHRPTDHQTPHAFAAMELLQQLATDPGVVAVVRERELVVGTLGELDPIDDRVMHKKQQQQPGSCLLGYNTNGGARIDIKLRTEDLKGFRPYPQLVTTLLHELSHNWVGEHNLLFWTNYGQMRAEYLVRHKMLQSTMIVGRTTADRAGLSAATLSDLPATILSELVPDMMPHGLHPRMIEGSIRQRCQELQDQFLQGRTLGGSAGHKPRPSEGSQQPLAPRERALAAAEERMKKQQSQSHLQTQESEKEQSSKSQSSSPEKDGGHQ